MWIAGVVAGGRLPPSDTGAPPVQEDFVSIRVIGKGSYGQARRADGLMCLV